MSELAVAVTGHRPQKVRLYELEIREKLRTALEQLVCIHEDIFLISGMALGVDQWAAEICIEKKIPFVAAVPFQGQEHRWFPEQQAHYYDLLRRARRVEILSEIYHPGVFQIRNVWMVDNSKLLLTVWNGDFDGGTANCIRYARKVGRDIFPVWEGPR